LQEELQRGIIQPLEFFLFAEKGTIRREICFFAEKDTAKGEISAHSRLTPEMFCASVLAN
jgi:hypothetical protein